MAMSDQMAGTYHEYKGKIKERFGDFTDDEFERVSGSLEQLVGFIQKKSGEARRTIETYLRDLTGNAKNIANDTAQQARDYAQQAGESVRQGYDRVASNVQDGYQSAQAAVRQRPVESLAVALGAGLLVGAVLGLMISSRSR